MPVILSRVPKRSEPSVVIAFDVVSSCHGNDVMVVSAAVCCCGGRVFDSARDVTVVLIAGGMLLGQQYSAERAAVPSDVVKALEC